MEGIDRQIAIRQLESEGSKLGKIKHMPNGCKKVMQYVLYILLTICTLGNYHKNNKGTEPTEEEIAVRINNNNNNNNNTVRKGLKAIFNLKINLKFQKVVRDAQAAAAAVRARGGAVAAEAAAAVIAEEAAAVKAQ